MPYPIWHVNTFDRNNSEIAQKHFDDFCSFCFFLFINNVLLVSCDYRLSTMGVDSFSQSEKNFAFSSGVNWIALRSLIEAKDSAKTGSFL